MSADPDVTAGVQLAHRLAVLAETDPEHPLMLAVRLALDVADARRAAHRALREAALDVHGGDRRFWRDLAAEHVPHAELQRRRQVPVRPPAHPPARYGHPFLDRLAAAGLPVNPVAAAPDERSA